MTVRIAFLSSLLLALLGLASAGHAAVAGFQAESDQAKTAKQIARMLEKEHYRKPELDDAFGEKVFTTYLEQLDPGKAHFIAEDIKEFSDARHTLHKELRRGKLDTAFEIYNRYHQRRVERIEYMLSLLDKGLDHFDFEREEYLELDREDAPWPADTDEIRDLWRRLVKNDLLNLKLGDTPDEEIVSTIKKRYENRLDRLQQTNSDDVFEYAMGAFTHSYDPHTDYFPPRESENFDIHMRLSLEGIGVLLQREDEYIKVVRVIPGGPTDRGKLLQPADRIVGVGQGEDGEIVNIEGWRLDDVVDKIRGPKGSVVRLDVIPADSTDVTKTRVVEITRDTVKLEEQSAQKEIIEFERGERQYKIGVIELPTFYVDYQMAMAGEPDYRSSTRDVERLTKELKEEGIDGLIVDLRNNGGGSLQEANELTGLFIPTGPVVQIRGAGDKVNVFSDLDPKVTYAGPLAVLVNRLSASASEIFAGAIQDHGRGLVVGSQTFGKGTVQGIDPLEPGRLKYTQAKYYRVSGKSTQERGIVPDITYPALLDRDQIGESALAEALPWDTIPAARYEKMKNLDPVIDYLDKRHRKRVSEHPDFRYLQERADFLEQNRRKTRTSLREADRRAEREQSEQRLLTMENRWRKAKGLEPLETYAELEKQQAGEEGERPSDGLLKETGDILIDWLGLEHKQVAQH
jgi:carboxyl-terminal processing protease